MGRGQSEDHGADTERREEATHGSASCLVNLFPLFAAREPLLFTSVSRAAEFRIRSRLPIREAVVLAAPGATETGRVVTGGRRFH